MTERRKASRRTRPTVNKVGAVTSPGGNRVARRDRRAASIPVTLTIHFGNAAAVKHFKAWLDGSGEQGYWLWMEAREIDEPTGDITATRFEYGAGGSRTITTTTGRLDKRHG